MGHLANNGTTGVVKIFTGGNLLHQLTLPDAPSALTVFRGTDDAKLPILAVACGDHLYAYKSLKPHLQFKLPLREPQSAEREAWSIAEVRN